MKNIRAHLSECSSNIKTGPIPVSSTSSNSCPANCPMRGSKKGCYGNQGNVRMVWNRIMDGSLGKAWTGFCEDVAALPENQLWRHNQVGDLPGSGDEIDSQAFLKLLDANQGKRGWTYTHYSPFKGANKTLIAYANQNGFTVNLSADCLAHADHLAELNIGPVVTVLPHNHEGNTCYTPEGRKVLVCPAESIEYMTCAVCKKCLRADRKLIIGFRAHGSCWKRVDEMYIKSTRRWARATARGVRFQKSLGKASLSAIARGLGFRSACGSTLRKVKHALNAPAHEGHSGT